MKNFNVAGNFQARVFIFREGVFRCNVSPEFFECMAIDSLAQDRGDITKIECPSPTKYGEFQEVYSFSGELSRVTTTVTTYMSRVSLSDFFKLFLDDCPFDMHVHFGECQNPTDFTQFDSALIFEDVRATSWGTDPLIALQSADKGIIQETMDISARRVLQLVNLYYTEVSTNVTVDGGFVKSVVADSRSCGGNCDNPSNGCQTQFAVTDDGYLYYTVDGGYVWAAEQVIDTAVETTAIPIDMAVVGDSILILTADDQVYVGSRREFLLSPSTATWDATDVSSALTVNAMDGTLNNGLIVGQSGTVASVNIYGDVEIVEDGALTSEHLLSVHLNQDGTALTGGANGALLFSVDNGDTWDAPTSPTTDDIVSVWAKSNRNWLIGTDAGAVWCTDDAGATWARVSFPGWGTATAPVLDIKGNSSHVLYMLQNNRVLKSIDGGSSWTVEPSNSKKTFPTGTWASIAACSDDINTVTVVGVNAATGIIVRGNPIN